MGLSAHKNPELEEKYAQLVKNVEKELEKSEDNSVVFVTRVAEKGGKGG
jgi:hypothetical protein